MEKQQHPTLEAKSRIPHKQENSLARSPMHFWDSLPIEEQQRAAGIVSRKEEKKKKKK